MKKTIVIALVLLVLVPLAGVAALFATREPPDGPRVEVRAGIVGVEAGGSFAWVVRTSHGAVLVDAGLDATGTAILAELKREGVQPDQVRAVLITHGHPDHYAAAPLFPKAVVFAGAADVAMMHGDGRHYSTFGKVMSAVMPLPKGPRAVTPLRGGEPLELDGAHFIVIATPGHSPGSVMYLHERVLFTGDSLMRKKDGLAVAPSLFSEDAAENVRSVKRLDPSLFDTIADGHAGVTRGAAEKLARLIAGR
jgi:hydroxyacylglutathione hydrolase